MGREKLFTFSKSYKLFIITIQVTIQNDIRDKMKNIQQKVLEESVCKTQNLITTSLTFKEDLINYFQNYDKKT